VRAVAAALIASLARLAGVDVGAAYADGEPALTPDPEPEPEPEPKLAPVLEPLPEPLEGGVLQILRATDRGRWEAGLGGMGGWRSLLDLHGRYYVSDTVTVGARLRFDLDSGAAPRALDFEIGKAIGVGKMTFPGGVMTRVRLVFAWGTSAVREGGMPVGAMFAGLALRLQPTEANWFSLELGVREAWAPRAVPAVAARAVQDPAAVELDYGLATELGASIAVLWPRTLHECVWR
jgi:hypothetical protein